MYNSITTYLCTLTQSCIISQNDSSAAINQDTPLLLYEPSNVVSTKDTFSITSECKEYISLLIVSTLRNTAESVTESQPETESSKWIKCGNIQLCKKDKIALYSGKELNDQHINAAQLLLKQQFPHLNGFQSTLYQLKNDI